VAFPRGATAAVPFLFRRRTCDRSPDAITYEPRCLIVTTTKRKGGKSGFSGNGDATLPPIRVPHGGTTLLWTNDGPVFSLFTERDVLIDSVAPEGTTFLPEGPHLVEIIASGKWAITIANFRRAR
jgi:hypothetical protein